MAHTTFQSPRINPATRLSTSHALNDRQPTTKALPRSQPTTDYDMTDVFAVTSSSISAEDSLTLPLHDQHMKAHLSRAFSFDNPTPDGSNGETSFNTPELEDLWWTIEQSTDQNQEQYTSDLHSNTESTMLLQDTSFVPHNLPSPQLTNTPTPEALIPAGPDRADIRYMAPLKTDNAAERSLTSLVVNTGTNASSVNRSQRHPVSPVIRISSHSRGDSPARSYVTPTRSTGKRNARDSAEEHTLNTTATPVTLNMLKPPMDPESVQWSHNDDNFERARPDPEIRSQEEVPSIKDIEEQQKLESTMQEVQSWLASAQLTASKSQLSRSRSTGVRGQSAQQPIMQRQRIPGPGVFIDEASDYYDSSDAESDGSPLPTVYPETIPTDLPLAREAEEISPEEQEPLPSQFYRRTPWQDPPHSAKPDQSSRFQPGSSNAAIYQFEQRAKNWETASRAATWGTGRRRPSDGEIDSINEDNKTRHLSLSKKTRDRGTSIINTLHEAKNKVRQSIPRRTSSHQKKSSLPGPPLTDLEKVASPDSIGASSTLHGPNGPTSTLSSHRHSKSPSQTTANSLYGISHPASGIDSTSTVEHEAHPNIFSRALRRVRSNSNVHKTPKSPHGLSSLLAQQGGMPVPSLAPPTHHQDNAFPGMGTMVSQPRPTVQDIISVKMDLDVKPANIVPNLDGFRLHVQELNPRLEPYLLERIAIDQLKRYKRLVRNKVEHKQVIETNSCPSKELCCVNGETAEVLPSKPGTKDNNNGALFKVASGDDSDVDESNFDGVVSAALFPEGIPLPPTKRLPARFECPICFKVKSFQKPSDWTKHVHEDVQPFTCTFPNCPEPKSFKRKADWVRHENERHRQLEWWKCNMHECPHKCFRKDNFVQHLVREHKKKEPKTKNKSAATAGRSRGRNAGHAVSVEEAEFWALVDACNHHAPFDPRDYPCKFCGNICTSWKKMAVHVGKHMEQLAMPVLELARQRNASKDTIISPVESPSNRPTQFHHENGLTVDFNAYSPYTHSGASNYLSSSAGQSPAVMHPQLNVAEMQYQRRQPVENGGQVYNHSARRDMHGTFTTNASYPDVESYDPQAYMFYMPQSTTYPPIQAPFSRAAPQAVQAQAMNANLDTAALASMPNQMYVPQEQYFMNPQLGQMYVDYAPSTMYPNGRADGSHSMQGTGPDTHMRLGQHHVNNSREYIGSPGRVDDQTFH